MKPSTHAATEPPIQDAPKSGFSNEPLTDFSQEANRTAMASAGLVREEFGRRVSADHRWQVVRQPRNTRITQSFENV